ncbi:CST complex subunit STN1-like [Actinia tenebrosa]|uniref:CST complex subunit STN1 n=1 Tax=Actinia tenebrosa TaxID=6105 RepID=A0A6P8HIK9_ACTTE|nr:CST complex subunit STN1-like [Actinia tenebrosa]
MATDIDLRVYYWGLNSTFWAHRKLFVKEIYELKESKEYKGIYQSGNHVIIRVEVLGTIVSVDDREKLTVYGVDDGTGIISGCYWKINSSTIDLYCLGQLVTFQGKLTTFRDQRQLTVTSIVLESNPNAEILFWLDVVKLNTEVYSTPYVLPDMASESGSSSSTQQLMEFLSKYTQESEVNGFSFRDLCSKSSVRQIALTSLGSNVIDQASNTRCFSEICKVVRKMLTQLEMKGEIYYKDASMDSYEIITDDHHLKPAIIKAIKDISKGSLHQGAHIARITDALHSTQSLCHVGSARILDSLKKLICESEIYQQSNQVYCIV